MRNSRVLFLVAILVIVAAASYWYFTSHNRPGGDHITVYYTKYDGTTEVPWTVSVRPGNSLEDTALYAAVQAVAGPPVNVEAIRFPQGTHVLSVHVNGSTADVDLSKEIESQPGGSLGETGEFKSLVWTLTALPGIDAVGIRIAGERVATLRGGNLELDKPLHRSDW